MSPDGIFYCLYLLPNNCLSRRLLRLWKHRNTCCHSGIHLCLTKNRFDYHTYSGIALIAVCNTRKKICFQAYPDSSRKPCRCTCTSAMKTGRNKLRRPNAFARNECFYSYTLFAAEMEALFCPRAYSTQRGGLKREQKHRLIQSVSEKWGKSKC